jgi:hypothetical protein
MIEYMEDLKEELPAILFRNNPRFKEITGVSPRTMANLDSLGLGPRRRVRNGRLIGYPKLDLLVWLDDRLKYEKGKRPPRKPEDNA